MASLSLRISAKFLRKTPASFIGTHQRILFRGFGLSGTKQARAATKSSDFGDRIYVDDVTGIRTLRIPKIRHEAKERTPKMVIFDKYGTLLDFHRTWTPWLANITKSLEANTDLFLEERILKKLDICLFTKKARPGILAEGTTSQVKRHLEDILTEIGFSRRKAQLIVEKSWIASVESDPSTQEQVTDLKKLFSELREKDIKIAVLTSGNRKETIQSFKHLDIESFVDCFLCGDDPMPTPGIEKTKVQALCEGMGVLPDECVVVGDTKGDVLMASQAGIGRTIGVLSGIGTRLDLYPHSDIVANNVQEALPYIMDFNTQPTSPKSKPTTSKSDVSLVIFDKDGTLICFNSMWTPWVMSMAKRLEEVSGLKVADKMLSRLGFCQVSGKWKPGIFAEGTTIQNMDVIQKLLEDEGLSPSDSEAIVQKVWEHGDHSEDNKDLKPLGKVMSIFRILHENGIKVAVCTADSRQSTEQFLTSLGANKYVDMLVCGDDPDAVPKPAAHNALKICQALGVAPEGCVMVGDTVADMGMGREAKLGATVAVLSGVGRVIDLDSQADIILPSIEHLLGHVLKKD